ncbi:MAG: PepSY domain-containing protein [Ahrensia sp.]|nr:PepSY domain-containing protein [Ahrensia sp.]
MKISKKLLSTGLAGVIGLGALGGAIAANTASDADNEKAEIAAAMNAKVSFTDALKIAETETGGKVLEAGIEVEDGKTAFYEVETIKADGTEQEVQIDATTGKVIKVSMDDDDEIEDSQDHDENDEEGADK